jgi:hypothetical protein
LRYAERVWPKVDLKDYNCRPGVAVNIICRHRNEADYAVHYPRLSKMQEEKPLRNEMNIEA